MIGDKPTVSVIIPTHNRNATLRGTLDALRRQTYSPELIEVLVVADGCTDGTAEMLHCYKSPFSLHAISQPREGPAAARNHGAARAKGRLLIFLDDDIESTPHLIEAHVGAHHSRSDRAVIGYLPPVLEQQNGFLQIALRRWWENVFHRMRRPGHRYTYRDLLSGNFSIEADLFRRVGGFDPIFWCHEDYELGVRLLKVDVTLAFAPEAVGYHHERTDFTRAFQRKYDEGRADVLICRRHPELQPVLRLSTLRARRRSLRYILRRSAFAYPAVGDLLAAQLVRMLALLERVRQRQRWSRLLDDLLAYWYWRGVAKEVGTLQALVNFLQVHPPGEGDYAREIDLDLSEGLDAAERRLDEEKPTGAHLRHGHRPVGRIPATPGAERLRGAHLRPILAKSLARPFLRAMALEQAVAGEDLICGRRSPAGIR